MVRLTLHCTILLVLLMPGVCGIAPPESQSGRYFAIEVVDEQTGHDCVLNALYKGRLYWFYGDTSRLSYALGNFAMSGAVTEPPEKLEPDVGFDLKYFVGKDGFARPMAPMQGEGVVWLFGLVV